MVIEMNVIFGVIEKSYDDVLVSVISKCAHHMIDLKNNNSMRSTDDLANAAYLYLYPDFRNIPLRYHDDVKKLGIITC